MVDGEVVSIRSLVSGTLDRVLVQEGSMVHHGDVVAEFNRDKWQNQLDELALNEEEIANSEERSRKKIALLRNNLAYWQKQSERFDRLQKSESVTGEQREKTGLQRLEAEANLYELEKTLAALAIQRQKLNNRRAALELNKQDLLPRAPVSGTVLELFVQQGETVLAGTNLADILDENSLYIDVFLEESELARIPLNSPAKIVVDGMAKREFSGVVALFGREAEFSPKYIVSEKERQSLLYRVKVRLTKDLGVFKVGMPVTVIFQPK
jgi:HlyD family secretion protein